MMQRRTVLSRLGQGAQAGIAPGQVNYVSAGRMP